MLLGDIDGYVGAFDKTFACQEIADERICQGGAVVLFGQVGKDYLTDACFGKFVNREPGGGIGKVAAAAGYSAFQNNRVFDVGGKFAKVVVGFKQYDLAAGHCLDNVCAYVPQVGCKCDFCAFMLEGIAETKFAVVRQFEKIDIYIADAESPVKSLYACTVVKSFVMQDFRNNGFGVGVNIYMAVCVFLKEARKAADVVRVLVGQ